MPAMQRLGRVASECDRRRSVPSSEGIAVGGGRAVSGRAPAAAPRRRPGCGDLLPRARPGKPSADCSQGSGCRVREGSPARRRVGPTSSSTRPPVWSQLRATGANAPPVLVAEGVVGDHLGELISENNFEVLALWNQDPLQSVIKWPDRCFLAVDRRVPTLIEGIGDS